MIWNEDGIVEFIGRTLVQRAREYDFENAPRGIDCLTEAALQQCIFAALNSQNNIHSLYLNPIADFAGIESGNN